MIGALCAESEDDAKERIFSLPDDEDDNDNDGYGCLLEKRLETPDTIPLKKPPDDFFLATAPFGIAINIEAECNCLVLWASVSSICSFAKSSGTCD